MKPLHVPPSWFVRQTCTFRLWCSIALCRTCGLHAKYEDAHPVSPCPRCGQRLSTGVGRWVDPIKASWLWKLAYRIGLADSPPKEHPGYWEVLP